METKYFNSKGQELIVGLTLTDVSEAAYSTNNPDDIIFSHLGYDEEFSIVNREVKIVKRGLEKDELLALIQTYRDEKIRAGIACTGTYRVQGVIEEGYTYRVRISDRIKIDLTVLWIASNVMGANMPEVPLKVGDNVYLILRNMMDITYLLLNGMTLVTESYGVEEAMVALVNSSSDTTGLLEQIRENFSAVDIKFTLS